MHKCIICIGSNYNRKENLLLARKRLADLFPSIRFTTERETQPLFFRSPALFSNQVALFFSEAEEEKVKKELKAIEKCAGRRPEDKKEEKVCLDIDLILVPVRKRRTVKSLKKPDWTICLIKNQLLMHKCIICIGSNYNRKENLLLARKRLADLFPSIRFTTERETQPLFFRSPALFSNQVALFFSEAEEEKVKKELKAIEKCAGRRPEDKKEEKVCLDIDLLSFDDRVLKPEDLKREYIVKGLEELK